MAHAPKPVKLGQPWRPDADAHMAFIEAWQYVEELKHSGGAGTGRGRSDRNICQVRNDSGGDVERFGVLGLDEPLILPEDNLPVFGRGPVWKGVTPTSLHAGRFVILTRPLASGAIGPAVISGVTVAKVDFAAGMAGYAEAGAGETACLEAVSDGSARVLWPRTVAYPEYSGGDWAVVRLGNPPGGVGHEVIDFEVISLASYLSEGSTPCVAVNAEVLGVSCNAQTVQVGDEVRVYDPAGCWFRVPIDVLEGARGQAVLMQRGEYEAVPDCEEYDEYGECWWLVQHLCCVEELYPD